MQRMAEQPYRELHTLFDHLVQVAEDALPQVAAATPAGQALREVLRQAQAYQHASCERCGTPFEASTLHEESYAAGGYQHVCPRCNRELGGQP
jgi:hypothetical protein